jgi:hypothetical protein
MALIQSDYDALQPQLVNAKWTAGPNSGKKITGLEQYRFNNLTARLVFSDGSQETLVFDGNVECYAPGASDTLGHLHS